MAPLVEEVRAELRALTERAPGSADGPELLSTAEAAALMRVKQATIRKWITEQRLTAHGTERVLRVKRADLLALRPDAIPPGEVQAKASNIVQIHGRE